MKHLAISNFKPQSSFYNLKIKKKKMNTLNILDFSNITSICISETRKDVSLCEGMEKVAAWALMVIFTRAIELKTNVMAMVFLLTLTFAMVQKKLDTKAAFITGVSMEKESWLLTLIHTREISTVTSFMVKEFTYLTMALNLLLT